MANIDRSPDELRAFFRDHVLYEIEMVFSLANYLAATKGKSWSRREEEVLQHAALEAFALHARVLLTFLWSRSPPKKNPNDAVAGQYVSGWSYMPAYEAVVKEVQGRVGMEVAHLSFGRLRLDQEAKKWPFAEMYYVIGQFTRSFLERVPVELVGSEAINAALEFLPPERSGEFKLSQVAGLLSTRATGITQELSEALKRAEQAE